MTAARTASRVTYALSDRVVELETLVMSLSHRNAELRARLVFVLSRRSWSGWKWIALALATLSTLLSFLS